MYLSIPRHRKGKNHPNPLSTSSDLSGLSSFEYGDEDDDGGSDG